MSLKTTKNQKSGSIVNKILSLKAGYGFKPNKEFYNSVCINQKRFGMICMGKISPTFEELEMICQHFKTELKEYL